MKKTTKTTLLIVAVCMAAMLFLGFATAGFTQWSTDEIKDNVSRKVNPDNYYTVECLALEDKNTGSGVKINVNEKNGAITIDGVAEVDITETVGTVTLDKGTYTLTAIPGASTATVYMTATVNGTVYKFDFNPSNTISIAADDTDVVLKVHIEEDAELNNVVVLPTIVEGNEAGSYWK